MTERQITDKIIKELKKRPFLWYYKSSDRFTSGIPDLIICYAGKFIALEVKKPKETATPLQEHILDKIREAGGRACVVTSVAEALSFIERR